MQFLGARHVQNNDSGLIDQFVVSVLQTAMERGILIVLMKLLQLRPNVTFF